MKITEELPAVITGNPAYSNILTRTSVRQYAADRPVTDAEITALLHAAMAAPSGVNRQPWELIVIDSRELLDAMAEALPYAKMLAHAPMAIAVCGNSARFLDGDDSVLWQQDVSAASENILLAANALGLGGVWTCLYPHPDRINAARRILAIPDGIIPFNIIPIGHPATPPHPRDKWQPARVHHNTY